MKDLPECPLREKTQTKSGQIQYRCSGSLNFVSLGPDAEFCQHCRILDLDLEEIMRCVHGEIYTSVHFVRGENDPITTVDYDVQCFAKTDEQRCSQCPEMSKIIANKTYVRLEDM